MTQPFEAPDVTDPEKNPSFRSAFAARTHEMITALGLTAAIALSSSPAQASETLIHHPTHIEGRSTALARPVATIALAAKATRTHRKIKHKKPKSPEWVPSVIGKRHLGVAVSERFMNSPEYLEVVKVNFDIVVPENEGKSRKLVPDLSFVDNPFFGSMDNIVNTASKNGQTVRYHTVLYGRQDPKWIEKFGYRCRDNFLNGKKSTSFTLDGILNRYTNAIGRHYEGKVKDIDVVNEPLETNGSMNNNAWYACLGIEYIDKAFRAARQADPHAKLFLNEIGTELPGPKQDALIKLVQGLKDRGVPIDGIGLQSHIDLDFLAHVQEFQQTLQKFASLGLIINITELDVSLPSNPTAADFQKQTKVYEAVVKTCVKQAACGDVIVWGVSDDKSWLKQNSPTLFGMDGIHYVAKPAYKIIRRLLR